MEPRLRPPMQMKSWSDRVQYDFDCPGAKFRQEEANEKAWKSPTLLNEDLTINRATLRVRNFSEADFKGLS